MKYIFMNVDHGPADWWCRFGNIEQWGKRPERVNSYVRNSCYGASEHSTEAAEVTKATEATEATEAMDVHTSKYFNTIFRLPYT
jgi:hypothetical protein